MTREIKNKGIDVWKCTACEQELTGRAGASKHRKETGHGDFKRFNGGLFTGQTVYNVS